MDRRVSGDLTTHIEGRERREITSAADLGYSADLTAKVRRCETRII